MAHTVTCHLRLLCLLKCLNTALDTKSQNCTDMTLLTCWVVGLRDKLWKRSQGRLTEDNPFGRPTIVSACCTRTYYDPVSNISNSTVTTCTDSSTEHSEGEGLGANIWCCSASAFCLTGELELLIAPLSERNSAGWAGQPRTLWPREEDGMSVYDSPSSDEESADDETACDVGEIPSLEREANFLLRRVSQPGRSIRFNSS